MAVNEDGKFTKKTAEVVKLIGEAAAMDCSIKEICLYANISKQTYYNWIDEDKKLAERIDELRSTPFLKARSTIIKGIEENYNNAMDYLKRKKKSEFGDNMDVTTGGDKLNQYNDEQITAIAKRINSNGGTPSEEESN